MEVALQYAPQVRSGDESPPPPAHYSVRRVLPVAPPSQLNWAGAAEHWTHSLGNVQRTTALLQTKCAVELQREEQQRTAAAASGGCVDPLSDTIAARQAVNESLATQLEFFTACMQAWAGPPRTSLA